MYINTRFIIREKSFDAQYFLFAVFDAIEIRYQLNWYQSKVNQMQLKSDMLQESYVKTTSQALQASKTEEDVGFNIVDVIYNETQVPNEYCQWYFTLICASFACRNFEI